MAKSSNPTAIQFTPFTEKHFTTPEGVSFVNMQMAQIINALNRGTGQAGPVVIPAGLDVAGGKVTGLGTPTGPTDAISSGHADSQYSAPVLAQQLDIGGSSSLKGLSGLYLLMSQSYTGTIPLAKLTGGGSNGSIKVVGGLIQSVVQPT